MKPANYVGHVKVLGKVLALLVSGDFLTDFRRAGTSPVVLALPQTSCVLCVFSVLVFAFAGGIFSSFCHDAPASLSPMVLKSMKISTVMKCVQGSSCSLHLNIKGTLSLDGRNQLFYRALLFTFCLWPFSQNLFHIVIFGTKVFSCNVIKKYFCESILLQNRMKSQLFPSEWELR